MSIIGWMENIIKILSLCHNRIFRKLWYDSRFYTHHRKVIIFSDRYETVFQVPFIHKYRKIKDNGWFIIRIGNLSHKAFKTYPLGLIPFIVYGKFHNDNVRFNFSIICHFFFITNHTECGRSSSDTGLYKCHMCTVIRRKTLTEATIRQVCIRFTLNRFCTGSLCDRTANIRNCYLFATLCLFNRRFQSFYISKIQQ